MTNEKMNYEYDGFCALAVSVGKYDVPAKEHHVITINNRHFRFANPVAKLLFKLLPGRVEKADAKWRNKTGAA